MTQLSLKAKVESGDSSSEVYLEFGRTQAEMSFSSTGSIQRKLKLKNGEKVEVIIKKE